MDRLTHADDPSADGSKPYQDDSRLRQAAFTGIDDPIDEQSDQDDQSGDRPDGRNEPAARQPEPTD